MIEASELIQQSGIGTILLGFTYTLLRRYERSARESRRNWEKMIEAQVRMLDDRTTALTSILHAEQKSRADMRDHLMGVMMKFAEGAGKMDRYTEAVKGFVASSNQIFKQHSTELIRLSKELTLVRTRK